MTNPTNKDLMHYIKDINEKIGDIQTKDLPEINARVKTTNGSVADIKAWKERVTGAIMMAIIVLVPLLTWGLYQIAHLDEKIQKVLSAYETPNQ